MLEKKHNLHSVTYPPDFKIKIQGKGNQDIFYSSLIRLFKVTLEK